MYLMYVDESGDIGLEDSPTRYFVLSGLVIHETRWRSLINLLIDFKKTMKAVYGLPVRAEIHASEYIASRVYDLDRHTRLSILRNFIDEIAKCPDVSLTNIVVDKHNKSHGDDIFELAWQRLFQRFENTLNFGNFPGGFSQDHGMVITDITNGTKLTRLVRRMAVHNYIPNNPQFGHGARNLPIKRLIEDPYGKHSADTLPVQVCDTVAYFLMQKYQPNSYIRRKYAQNYFDRLSPVLNKHASRANGFGIVKL